MHTHAHDTYVHMQTHIHTHVTYKHTHMYTHIHTHVTYKHTHVHTHTHTNTHTQSYLLSKQTIPKNKLLWSLY